MKRLVALLGLCASVGAYAQMYRWIDDAGRVQFGDRPPPGAQRSEVRVRINTYEGVRAETLDRALAVQRYVIIHTVSWCHVCAQAKRHSRANDIDYVEYDLETSVRGKRDFEPMNGKSVPIIMVGRKRLNGFSSASFERAYGASD